MCVYQELQPRPLSRAGERDARELVDLVERIAAAGELEPAHWNIAHADLALTLMRLAKTGYSLSDRVRTFLDAAVQRPSMRAYIEHPRPPFRPPDAYAAG
jgi:hypothetical protein